MHAGGVNARRTSPGDVFWLSAVAKLGATMVTYPLQLVKARLMSSGKHTSAERRYTGTLDALERIWRTEGARPGLLTLSSCSNLTTYMSLAWGRCLPSGQRNSPACV